MIPKCDRISLCRMAITMNDYDVDEPYNMEDYLWSSMQVGDVLHMDGQTHIGWQPGRDF